MIIMVINNIDPESTTSVAVMQKFISDSDSHDYDHCYFCSWEETCYVRQFITTGDDIAIVQTGENIVSYSFCSWKEVFACSRVASGS